MHISRSEFGLMAASTFFIAAVPRIAFADPDDDVHPDGHHGLHASGKKRKAGPTNATFIEHAWNFTFRSDAIAEDQWKYVFPQHGQASILIDYKGNWQYEGSFPAQKLELPCRVTVGVGLKSSIGQIVGFTKTLTVSRDGASWSKHGHDQIIEDLWKNVVKGHEYKWSAHTHQEAPNEPPPAESARGGGGGEASTFNQVIGDIGKSLLGPFGSLF